MALRVTLAILILLSLLYLPFYVSLILGLAGIIYFPVFWEIVALFLLSDLLFGAERTLFFGKTFVATFIAIIILSAGEMLKKKLKFYPTTR